MEERTKEIKKRRKKQEEEKKYANGDLWPANVPLDCSDLPWMLN